MFDASVGCCDLDFRRGAVCVGLTGSRQPPLPLSNNVGLRHRRGPFCLCIHLRSRVASTGLRPAVRPAPLNDDDVPMSCGGLGPPTGGCAPALRRAPGGTAAVRPSRMWGTSGVSDALARPDAHPGTRPRPCHASCVAAGAPGDGDARGGCEPSHHHGPPNPMWMLALARNRGELRPMPNPAPAPTVTASVSR